jgi:hypothetical protein
VRALRPKDHDIVLQEFDEFTAWVKVERLVDRSFFGFPLP